MTEATIRPTDRRFPPRSKFFFLYWQSETFPLPDNQRQLGTSRTYLHKIIFKTFPGYISSHNLTAMIGTTRQSDNFSPLFQMPIIKNWEMSQVGVNNWGCGRSERSFLSEMTSTVFRSLPPPFPYRFVRGRRWKGQEVRQWESSQKRPPDLFFSPLNISYSNRNK